MLAVVKEPRIEISISGASGHVKDFLDFIRAHYQVSVLSDNLSSDEESVNAFETDFWKQTTPGDLLQGFRLKHGFSQKALAEKSGIPQTVISACENGKRKLTRRTAVKLANALNEKPEKFFP